MTPNVEIHPLACAHRFAPGDPLAPVLLDAVRDTALTLEDGDVVCVASKVVALSEGALIDPAPAEDLGGDAQAMVRALARARASEVVAEAPWVTVTRTHHGFVAANGGIDRSNVPGDGWLDLPHDPDASAASLRAELRAATGRDVAVLVTDTFGRPWRLGQTDVALGAAGLAVLRDERGGTDLDGRTLGVTVGAVGDAIAGAADLVRNKASATPFVLVRGLASLTAAGGARAGRGADLIRPLDEDLFRRGRAESILEGLTARRTVRTFAEDRPVPTELLDEAIAVAMTAPSPHDSRPLRVVRLTGPARERLLTAMGEAWRADLRADGVSEERSAPSDGLHRSAPELLVILVDPTGARIYPDERRRRAERDLFLLAGGAATEALLVALAARGLGAAWTSAPVFCAESVRTALDLPEAWEPVGMVCVGWPRTPLPPGSVPDADGASAQR